MAHKAAKQLEESTSKRPKRAASAAQQAVAAVAAASAADKWSAENEVFLLETFLAISEDLGVKPSYEQIYEAVQGSIPDNFSTKDRVGTKLRHLKRKFLRAHTAASPPIHDLVYQLSEKIWGDAAGAADDEAEAEEEAEAEGDAPVSAAPKPKPKRKRETKATPVVAAPLVQHEKDMTTEKDAIGEPRKSPRGHSGTAVPLAKKKKPKSKRLTLVATGHPSSALPLDDSYMLPGLVRIVQQAYSDVDEKLVRTALNGMDGPLVEKMKKDWRKLQLLKLEAASLTSRMATELVGVLHQRAAAQVL